MITVVGITGTSPQVDETQEILNATVVSRSSNFTLNKQVVETYDRLFEREDLLKVPREISEDILSHSQSGDVIYLVPGRGAVGDVTVELLASLTEVQIVSSSLPFPVAGQLQIVDALALAIAEQQSPFDSGKLALDTGMPLLVTNWTGTLVPKLATKRIARLYGPHWSGERMNESELFVPPLRIDQPSGSPAHLTSLASFLRTPEGCPWDREQSVNSLLPSLLEEVTEFEESVQHEDDLHQIEELGDILINLMMIAQIAHEEGRFSLDDVFFGISEKIIRRHPHVFGNEKSATAEEVLAVWQRVKDEEQLAKKKK